MPQIVVGNFAVEIGVASNAGAYGDGTVTQANSSTITVHYPDVNVNEHYYGNFLYDGTGSLAGGTLTAYDQVLNGQYIVQATELSLSATQVANAIISGNSAQLLQIVLGGNDYIFSNIYDDTIYSQGGNDTVIALDGYDFVDGGSGDDDLNGNKGADTVHGGLGSDFVRGGQGNDLVYGDDGDDLHVNGNIGDDTVRGGNGADSVYGGQGNDLLYGDAGNDYLSGDLGSDTLTGGTGADSFHLGANSGHDYVTDFSASQGDRVILDHGATYTVGQSGADTLVTLSTGEQLTLQGVTAANLPSGWIVVS